MVTRAVVAVLAGLLPAGFRDRQRAEWLGDLGELSGWSRPRYLLAATLTLPSLYAAVRRRRGAGHGMRLLTLPRGDAAYPLVVAFALITGMFGAAVAGRLDWTPPGPLLTAAAAHDLTAAVFPGRPVDGRPDAPAFGEDADGTRPGSALFVVPSVPAGRDLRADTATARDALAGAGWTIDDDVHSELEPNMVGVNLATDASWAFTAHTDRLTLEFAAWRFGARTATEFSLARTSYPRAPVLLLLAAGVPAALAGWVAACRLYRRATVRAALATITLLAVAPAAFLLAARQSRPIPGEPEAPLWHTLFVAGGDKPYGYAALVTVLAVILAAWPAMTGPMPSAAEAGVPSGARDQLES